MCKKERKGFTVIELLGVIIVLGILIGIIILSLRYSSNKGKEKIEEVFVGTLKNAVDIYLSGDEFEFNNNKASWKNKCTPVIDGESRNLYKYHENKSFDDVIASKLAPISVNDMINPIDASRKQCDINSDNISIYKDERMINYYFFTLDCLEYTCFVTNLPASILNDSSCGISLPQCNTSSGFSSNKPSSNNPSSNDPSSNNPSSNNSSSNNPSSNNPSSNGGNGGNNPGVENPVYINKPDSVSIYPTDNPLASEITQTYKNGWYNVSCMVSGNYDSETLFVYQFGIKYNDGRIVWSDNESENVASKVYKLSTYASTEAFHSDKDAYSVCRAAAVKDGKRSDFVESSDDVLVKLKNVKLTFKDYGNNGSTLKVTDLYVGYNDLSLKNWKISSGKVYSNEYGSSTKTVNFEDFDTYGCWADEFTRKCVIDIDGNTIPNVSGWTNSSGKFVIEGNNNVLIELKDTPQMTFIATSCRFEKPEISKGNIFIGNPNFIRVGPNKDKTIPGDEIKIIIDGFYVKGDLIEESSSLIYYFVGDFDHETVELLEDPGGWYDSQYYPYKISHTVNYNDVILQNKIPGPFTFVFRQFDFGYREPIVTDAGILDVKRYARFAWELIYTNNLEIFNGSNNAKLGSLEIKDYVSCEKKYWYAESTKK